MYDTKETCWDHIAGERVATFCTGEKKFLNLIGRLREKYPDEVEIVHENQDGSMVVRLPSDWLKVGPKRRIHMSPEQIEAATMRLKKMREEKSERGKYDTEGSASCVNVKGASGMEAAE